MARTNLIPNPSFRQGLTGYSAINGASIVVSAEKSFYGSESLLVSKSAQNNSGFQSAAISVTAGLSYSFSAYALVPTTLPATETANLLLKVSWYNYQGTLLSESQSSVVVLDPDTSWTRLTGVTTAPNTAVSARISLSQLAAGTAGQIFYADALLFEQSSYVGGYLDNLSQSDEDAVVNRSLSTYTAPTIGGLPLEADIILGDLVLNTIDENNVVWVCTNLDGWYGQADPETTDIPRGVEDGSYDVSGRTQARVITLTGSMLLPDPSLLGAARDRLVQATNLVRKGAWLRTNEEPTRAAFVRLSGKVSIETVNARGRTDFSIGLKAADPIRYEWNDQDPDGLSSDTVSGIDPIINLATNPSFETSTGTTVATRTNLLLDPAAMAKTTWGLRGFGTGGAGTYTAVATGGPSDGPWSYMRKTWTTAPSAGGGTNTGFSTSASTFAVTPGQTYTWSGYLRSSANGHQGYARLSFYNGTTFVQDINGTMTLLPASTSGWTRVSVTGVVPSGVTQMAPFLDVPENGAVWQPGDTLDGTGGLLEQSPVLGFYFDGYSPGAGDFTFAWSGAASNSSSSKLGVGVAQTTSVNSYSIVSTDWYNTQSHSLRNIPASATNTNTYVALNGDVGSNTLGLLAGHTYTIVATCYLAAPLINPRLGTAPQIQVIAKQSTGNYQTYAGPSVPNTAGAHETRFTLTIPSSSVGGAEIAVRLYSGTTLGSGDVWWDSIAIMEVPDTSHPYTEAVFSGDTLDTTSLVYTWTGVPNASTSTRIAGPVVMGSINNIGTADVTGVFDLHGPIGSGSTISNVTTGQTITTTKDLRGSGPIATVVNKELTDNVVTITTGAPHNLVVGDKIIVSGVGSPFDAVNETLTVTAVTDLIPYTFNYVRQWPNIVSSGSSGQVILAEDDLLSLDTYNRSVTFNGDILGNRSRIETLVDWIKLAPGENIIRLTDNPAQQQINSKVLANNVVTLTTDDAHFFTPGEQVYVNLPTTATLAIKSLTNNVVTLTTATNHGFSVGDTINVVSTSVSNIITKSVTSNVATLTTDVLGSFNIGDLVLINLPTTVPVVAKAATNNVVTLTTALPHGFSVGDSITAAFAAGAGIASKSLSNNVATLSTDSAHGFSAGDPITVTLPASTTIVQKYISGQSVILTSSTGHGFSLGDRVTIALPTTATTTTGRTYSGASSYLTTVTTTSSHGFVIGDRVSVDGGTHIVETTPSTTTFTYLDYTKTTAGSAAVSAGTVTNLTNQAINGTFPIASVPSATQFSYSVSV